MKYCVEYKNKIVEIESRSKHLLNLETFQLSKILNLIKNFSKINHIRIIIKELQGAIDGYFEVVLLSYNTSGFEVVSQKDFRLVCQLHSITNRNRLYRHFLRNIQNFMLEDFKEYLNNRRK